MSFDEDLKNCNNMKQVLVVVDRYYNLEKPFGVAVKIGVQMSIKRILTFIKAEKK